MSNVAIIPENPIEEFSLDCNKRSTQMSYASIIRLFIGYTCDFKSLQYRYSDGEEKVILEQLARKYLTEEHNLDEDLIKYFRYLINVKHYHSVTVKGYLAVLKLFFTRYGWNISSLSNVKKKIPNNWQSTRQVDLTMHIIRMILLHSDIKLRAMILILLSSGMRSIEMMNLKIEDIKPVEGESFYSVFIRASTEKTGHAKTTFITAEAYSALQEWMKVREHYIKYKRYFGKKEDNGTNKPQSGSEYIFFFSKSVEQAAFVKALKNAQLYELDEETGKTTIHLHQFRNYFRTQLLLQGIPEAVVEKMIHHNSNAYSNFGIKSLAEQYKRGMHALTTEVNPVVLKRNELLEERLRAIQEDNIAKDLKNNELSKEVGVAMELILKMLVKDKAFG